MRCRITPGGGCAAVRLRARAAWSGRAATPHRGPGRLSPTFEGPILAQHDRRGAEARGSIGWKLVDNRATVPGVVVRHARP